MTQLRTATISSASRHTAVPAYDRTAVSPGIVHIGVGGFHRAHQAAYLDSLLAADAGARSFGISGISLLPQDRRIVEVMNDQDCLYTLLVRHSDGSIEPRVIGSIVEHLFAPDDPERVLTRMADPATRIVSLTITEGGYFYRAAHDQIDMDAPDLEHDRTSPSAPRTAFGYIIEALRRRTARGTPPFTVLSCDNVHANGDVARRVVVALATAQNRALGEWIESNVGFPNSMVDRITPRTSDSDIEAAAAATGLTDAWPVACEPFAQWVIEDRFTDRRPAWELVGAQFVTDVRPYELMKMRILNAGHQTISYAGRLLGHRYGHQSSTDPVIGALLDRYTRTEAATTLPDVAGIDVDAYCTTIAERFANRQIRDTITRLTSQSSTSLPSFVLPVIRDLLDRGRPAPAATAVVAAWARFLEGVDDAGRRYEVDDARSADLCARAARHDDDLLAVIRGNPLFHGLEGRPEFERPYADTLRDIRTAGTRAALTSVLGPTGPAVRGR
ncbi:mannitol dehydrogenase family protein [Actinoplanes sp. NPDC049265]|uniref:mannitol dehydrogenase family protein n=1 Tax=Actinoplanes sp. NPDC049265 TaxID=3363902 RepID=UPI003714581F